MNNNTHRRILIADDTHAIHEDFRKILAGTRGSSELDDLRASLFGEREQPRRELSAPAFQLDSAFQGQDALAMVKQSLAEGRPYSMAFVDVRMPPGWDG